MVSHEEHRRKTKKLLNKPYTEVHRYLDKPFSWKIPRVREVNFYGTKIPIVKMERLGRLHRRYRHDIATAILLGLRTEDPRIMMAAIQHLIDDNEI